MKFIATILAASAIVAASAAELTERDFEHTFGARAMTCAQVTTAAGANLAVANSFCQVYLQISPKTVTQTSTVTRATVTVSMPTYTTTVLSVTPNAVLKKLTKTNTQTVSVTPATSTVTATVTSTAYLDGNGNTMTVMKRDAPSPVADHVARAIATPAWLKGMSKTDIRNACACLNIPTPTYTVIQTAAATSTVIKALQRKIIKTTTLATVTNLSTLTATKSITVTVPAPRVTATAYEIDNVSSCPPNTDSTWICPDQTADDDGSDPNYENCAVVAQDGYSGYCLYWADDGSPAGSTLSLGDGSGDPANDDTRDAVYGDDPTDDCPSWADWTCSASTGGSSKRSTLEVESADFEFSKRGYIPKRLSVAQHKRLGRTKMPKGLKRGGKYKKTSV